MRVSIESRSGCQPADPKALESKLQKIAAKRKNDSSTVKEITIDGETIKGLIIYNGMNMTFKCQEVSKAKENSTDTSNNTDKKNDVFADMADQETIETALGKVTRSGNWFELNGEKYNGVAAISKAVG